MGALFNSNQKRGFIQLVRTYDWDSFLVSNLDLGCAEYEVVSGAKQTDI